MDVKSKIAFFEAKSINTTPNITNIRPKEFNGFLKSHENTVCKVNRKIVIFEDKSNSEVCKVNRKNRRKVVIFEDQSNSEDCRLYRSPSSPKKRWNLLCQNWQKVALKNRNLALSVT